MRGALTFCLLAGLVAGVTMTATLAGGHELHHGWWLVFAVAGAGAAVGLVIGVVYAALTGSLRREAVAPEQRAQTGPGPKERRRSLAKRTRMARARGRRQS